MSLRLTDRSHCGCRCSTRLCKKQKLTSAEEGQWQNMAFSFFFFFKSWGVILKVERRAAIGYFFSTLDTFAQIFQLVLFFLALMHADYYCVSYKTHFPFCDFLVIVSPIYMVAHWFAFSIILIYSTPAIEFWHQPVRSQSQYHYKSLSGNVSRAKPNVKSNH